jgi:hypothetical protein
MHNMSFKKTLANNFIQKHQIQHVESDVIFNI